MESDDHPYTFCLPCKLLQIEVHDQCKPIKDLECNLKVAGVKGEPPVFVLRAEVPKNVRSYQSLMLGADGQSTLDQGEAILGLLFQNTMINLCIMMGNIHILYPVLVIRVGDSKANCLRVPTLNP